MTSTRPPRVAFLLLRRFVPDNDPLVGDLVEQFATKRSRAWFWRQVIVAIAVNARTRPVAGHPLRLIDDLDAPVHRELPRHVNLSASPLPDVGGLGVLVLVLIVAMARPEAWWMMVMALAGGALLGAVLVLSRRRRVLSSPGRSRPLFEDSSFS